MWGKCGVSFVVWGWGLSPAFQALYELAFFFFFTAPGRETASAHGVLTKWYESSIVNDFLFTGAIDPLATICV